MRKTVWTLLIALLLQWLAGSAWALGSAQAGGPAPQCHESVLAVSASMHHGDDEDTHTVHTQHSGHHCCVTGLGTGLSLLVLALPKSSPTSPSAAWASLTLCPDLRPPI